MSTLWPPELRHRAPPEFPPRWASAWGDDAHGLWADWVLRTPHGQASQRLRWIEPSQGQGFWMGSTQAERDQIEDKDARDWANGRECEPMQVRIAQGFWLADTPVTQALWQAATGHNPSRFAKGPDAALRPVESVPLADLGRKEGRANTDVLDFLQALQAQLPTGHVATLPTEMEWEYACRADTRSAYPWGDAFDPDRANTNHKGDKGWGDKQGTSPVKTYPPNPWGLYDMQAMCGNGRPRLGKKSGAPNKPGPSAKPSSIWAVGGAGAGGCGAAQRPSKRRRNLKQGDRGCVCRARRLVVRPPRLRALGLSPRVARRRSLPLPGLALCPEVFQHSPAPSTGLGPEGQG